MPFSNVSPRLLRSLAFFSLLLGLAASGAHAALVWDAQSGWRIEGGALAGVTGEASGRTALELMNRARAAEERGNTRAASSLYRRVNKNYGSSLYAPEALFRLGGIQAANRQYRKAFASYQEIITKHPNSPRFNETLGAQYRIASSQLDGNRGRALGIIPTLRNRERIITQFETILANAPFSEYAPLTLMNIARANQRANRPELAIDALDRMINTYPSSFLTPDAYLKLAQTHADLVDGPPYDQGATRQAITYYEDFLILYPNNPDVDLAQGGLGSMMAVLSESKMVMGDFYYYRRNNLIAARVFYNEAITAFPDSSVAIRARRLLVEIDAKIAQVESGEPAPRRPSHQKRFWLF